MKRTASRLLLSLVLFVPTLAAGDYIAPEAVKVNTVHYQPSQIVFNPGKYRYAINWEGIPVATAEIVMGENPTLTRDIALVPLSKNTIRVNVKTARVIDLLYRLRFTGESVFDALHARPVKFLAEQTENSKYKRWDISFLDNTNILSRLWKDKDDAEPAESKEFTSNNFTLDPLFGAILARSIPVRADETVSFDIWNGKNRFLISFKIDGREEIKIGKRKILTDRVIPQVQKLTDSEGEKRLRSCTLWVSADERRDIVKVESKVLFGSITAKLESIEPLNVDIPQIIQAKEAEPTLSQARAKLKDSKESADLQ